jgi:hypothetical protein
VVPDVQPALDAETSMEAEEEDPAPQEPEGTLAVDITQDVERIIVRSVCRTFPEVSLSDATDKIVGNDRRDDPTRLLVSQQPTRRSSDHVRACSQHCILLPAHPLTATTSKRSPPARPRRSPLVPPRRASTTRQRRWRASCSRCSARLRTRWSSSASRPPSAGRARPSRCTRALRGGSCASSAAVASRSSSSRSDEARRGCCCAFVLGLG